MTTTEWIEIAAWAALGFAVIPLGWAMFRAVTIEVDDEEAVLVTELGKWTRTFRAPGLVVLPLRLMPWVRLHRVSLRRDFREFEGIHINDARGTTLLVDLWIELRVDKPEKALFQVEDWDRSLRNLVHHAATSILGNREFNEILCDRNELAQLVERDIATETARWGVQVDLVFIRNVRLLPEVSQQMFENVAARLERAKADIEEEGRLQVAMLEAETAARIAKLVADAKGQYPASVGRAFASLRDKPRVLEAYHRLYELSVMRPHRTITFDGFGDDEMRAVDAVLMAPGAEGGGLVANAFPALGPAEKRRV